MNPNSDPKAPPFNPFADQRTVLRRRRWGQALAIAVALSVGAIWYASSRPASGANVGADRAAPAKAEKSPLQRATPVVVAPVRQDDLDIFQAGLGTVTPKNTVQVQSRVDGLLVSVVFKEGQMVKKGDLLAEIDPQPFKLQLNLAAGQLARDQALLEGAQVNLERYRKLLALKSMPLQQFEAQQTLVRQYKASVQLEQGSVDTAKLQLSYSRITAPIGGRVGLRQVGPGSFVRSSDPVGIVVITQLQPIGVVFSIPEDTLPRVMRRLGRSDRIRVDVYDRAQKLKLGSGHLLAADNQIDPATGTIKLKAEFKNTDGALIPNQFVNVKMLVETRKGATLVPTAALQRGTVGTFVYLIKADKTASVVPVTVVSSQGEVTAIEGGIAIGALVVVDGADNLREGVKVELANVNKTSNAKSIQPGDKPAGRSSEGGV